MASLMLFYVGAVLFCNGLWILGHIDDKELAVIDFFVGALGVFVAIHGAFTISLLFAAQILLFAFTYLWVALNRYLGVDGRGLGWFCLFVALSALPWGIKYIGEAEGGWPLWLALNWIAWAVLWFMFFLLLALKKTNIARITGWVTLIQGVVTGWLPGWLLLTGYMA